MLLSYAIVMFILSVFNVVMSGFNIFLWILHITMAMVAFFMCVTLRREENQAYEDNL